MSTNEVNINDERSVRLKKLQDLQELNINSYPSKTSRTNTLAEALNAKEGDKFVCVGRIMMKREIGKSKGVDCFSAELMPYKKF